MKMKRTRRASLILFLGQMAGLGLFLGSFRARSAGLAAAGVVVTAIFGAAALFLRCPNCGARPPKSLDLFDPRWKCEDCDHEV